MMKKWKIVSIILVVLMCTYFGYFSFLQTRDFEGSDRTQYQEVKDIVGDSVLFIDKNEFVSYNQVAFPLRYYFGTKIFPVKEIESIKDFDGYYLSRSSELEDDDFKVVKEIDFRHNYFVHCNREEDKYFEMEDHSKDIPFCKYIIIPNRYYYGVYKIYLYELR